MTSKGSHNRGPRVSDEQKLTVVMQRNLARLLDAEQRGVASLNMSTVQALGLDRRGLIVARMNFHRGMDCSLTAAGRAKAQALS